MRYSIFLLVVLTLFACKSEPKEEKDTRPWQVRVSEDPILKEYQDALEKMMEYKTIKRAEMERFNKVFPEVMSNVRKDAPEEELIAAWTAAGEPEGAQLMLLDRIVASSQAALYDKYPELLNAPQEEANQILNANIIEKMNQMLREQEGGMAPGMQSN